MAAVGCCDKIGFNGCFAGTYVNWIQIKCYSGIFNIRKALLLVLTGYQCHYISTFVVC